MWASRLSNVKWHFQSRDDEDDGTREPLKLDLQLLPSVKSVLTHLCFWFLSCVLLLLSTILNFMVCFWTNAHIQPTLLARKEHAWICASRLWQKNIVQNNLTERFFVKFSFQKLKHWLHWLYTNICQTKRMKVIILVYQSMRLNFFTDLFFHCLLLPDSPFWSWLFGTKRKMSLHWVYRSFTCRWGVGWKSSHRYK